MATPRHPKLTNSLTGIVDLICDLAPSRHEMLQTNRRDSSGQHHPATCLPRPEEFRRLGLVLEADVAIEFPVRDVGPGGVDEGEAHELRLALARLRVGS